jgi:solute:Na+ symporter, SSS family
VMPDNAYPSLLNLLPEGFKGLSFAALTAAVVASLAGKANSISTIFTLDIYRKIFNKNSSEKNLVLIGKITVVLALIVAVSISRFLGIEKGGFNFIQEYTGYVSPGIFAMFILGFFWKKTTSNAALFATIGGFIFSVIFSNLLPKWIDLSFLASTGFSIKNSVNVYEIPFLDRMGFVFLICIISMWIISTIENKRGVIPKGLEIDKKLFKLDTRFAVGAILVIGVLVALYTVFW